MVRTYGQTPKQLFRVPHPPKKTSSQPRMSEMRTQLGPQYKVSGAHQVGLTLKAPVTTVADDIHKYFFIVFSEKIRLDVSNESSARQRIHMKNQALFSSKDKNKKLKYRLLQFLSGALRVKIIFWQIFTTVFRNGTNFIL